MPGSVGQEGEPGGDVCGVAIGVGAGERAEVGVEGGEAGAGEEGVGSDKGLQGVRGVHCIAEWCMGGG